jgi:hypothetical protein
LKQAKRLAIFVSREKKFIWDKNVEQALGPLIQKCSTIAVYFLPLTLFLKTRQNNSIFIIVNEGGLVKKPRTSI